MNEPRPENRAMDFSGGPLAWSSRRRLAAAALVCALLWLAVYWALDFTPPGGP